MQRLSLFALSLLLAAQASANVVLYTDRYHPPVDDDLNVQVIFLDAPDTVQVRVLGELPTSRGSDNGWQGRFRRFVPSPDCKGYCATGAGEGGYPYRERAPECVKNY